jgi:hypothetical protein
VRIALSAFAAALFAAVVMPLLFIGAESAVQWAPILADDFPFAYALVGPFALVVALAVGWPSYSLQPSHLPLARRLLVASAICFAVPTAVFLPLADDFPWKAGLAGGVTLLVWAWAFRFAGRFMTNDNSDRSEPSG